ncbi:unnamed protein product [Cyprideis torosa]|uniref:Hsp90 co-chaperone Cdc37 n=1 Tax=Cyprideis torosa TaxID=163714 RepID=A0A7R8ZML0_9CRUS|nr:unnamed protein product [Cyprideis torosa]CAG0886055.1 unnamed protein product [Cyprideis torosa]
MSGIDYSKWKDIEVSDDEDDTHPNIDTPSLFRWRHQARIERMQEMEKKRKTVNDALAEVQKKIADLGTEESNERTVKLNDLKKEEAEWMKKKQELDHEEKLAPWNVDTISKPGFDKSRVNPVSKPKAPELTEEEKEKRLQEFIDKNKEKMRHFGMLRRYDDSKRYLQENMELVCEETANYLVMWCINLEMEEKHELSAHVAHQCICMQFILELAKQLERDPRACVGSFFSRIQTSDELYKEGFKEELDAFKARIRRRAKEKLEEALAEAEEEEKKARLGPGGLDPVEVMESLPEKMRECFEKQDIPLLQKTIMEMDIKEAKYHMKSPLSI